MKKFGLLFSILLIITKANFSQTLIFIDHFNYNAGSLVSSTSNWTTHSGTTPGQVNVLDSQSDTASSLRYNDTYSWYFNPSEGNRVELTESESEDVGRSFAQTYNSGTIYYSFLLKVTAQPSGAGTYFIHYFQGTAGTNFGASIFIRSQLANTFQLGINARTTIDNTVWYNSNLNLNQTYLIVASYQFVTGSGNDISSLWVNPFPLELNNIPSPVAVHTNTGGPDLSNVGRLGLRQSLSSGSGMGTLQIDEIRVSNDWNLAPLPVELSSFSASVVGNAVKLNWKTETEVNNYGFDIERSLPQPLPKEGAFGTPLPLGKGQGDGLWTKIGFVNGNGNSNSPKSYTFTDTDVLSGKYSYRLKQIDNDGQFEYSKTIEVDLGAPKKFELSQNYPNPFNPTTTIRFSLPDASLNPSQGGTLVKLTVYNVLGQQVAVLVNDILEAGVHTINFNASELNSGIYIYKLEAGSLVQTRKMTLIK